MTRFQYLPRFPQNVSNFWYSNLPFYKWTHRWAWQSPPSPIRDMEQIHEVFRCHSVYFLVNIYAANRCPMIAQKMREKYIRAFLSVEFNRVHLISLSKWYKKFIVPTLSAPTIHPGATPCQLLSLNHFCKSSLLGSTFARLAQFLFWYFYFNTYGFEYEFFKILRGCVHIVVKHIELPNATIWV